MYYLFLILAFLTGIAISIQAGVNSNLRLALNNPLLASLISFGTGFFTLLIVHLSTGGLVPQMATLRSLSWWKWTGGIIGAVYVTTVILSVPRIGTANLVSLSVAGQLLAAVVLDHYGLLGFTQHSANGWRLLGIGLILLGVLLVVKN
ncbi:DMT family transporter [uncultured Fibrella sp.]|uniref:DMT family transporter n=1 Tax=uncultured Fibrella sp. TaxID=1284596 RepID=UPI0035CBE59D